MTLLILRCPICGTTQDKTGECEACHEAEVRYFCPNHTPGEWLDGPSCTECGATPERGPAESPPPPSPHALPRTRTTVHDSVLGRRTEPPAWTRHIETPPRSAPPPVRHSEESEPAYSFDPLEVLRKGAEAARRGESTEVRERAPRRSLPIAGCLMRLVLVVLALCLLAIAAIWFIAGGTVREFAVDLGQSTGVVGGVPQQTLRGIAAYRRGDLTLAERELDQAARSYRRSALALLYLARIRIESNDSEGAGGFLDEAVLREPDNPVAHRMLGEHHLVRAQNPIQPRDQLYTTSELAAAEEHLSRAVQLNPADRRARGYRACVLASSGRAAEARAERSAAGAGPWESCNPGNITP